ncbi:hypothetical protein LEMLEM_LOCUS16054, partial [Lemmus lemmus]
KKYTCRGGILVPLVTREDSAVFPVASRKEHLDLGDCEVLSSPPWFSMNRSKRTDSFQLGQKERVLQLSFE